MKPIRLAALKTPGQFRQQLRALDLDLPCDDQILPAPESPLAQSLPGLVLNGKTLKNRFAIHPMEGWDASPTGAPTDAVLRRWQRFGQSGAALIFGGEAMAVRPDGRANANQLIINRENQVALGQLRRSLLEAHHQHFGTGQDPVIGFQLTHSGRYSRPQSGPQPLIAYRHPILDPRLGITDDRPVISDPQLEDLVGDFVRAARVAYEVGADFVDVKHCHGYLLHELLSAHLRPGPFGGSFENRTRLLRLIVQAIRADRNPIDIAVRLSAFDFVPFRPDPVLSSPGRPGPGIPEPYSHLLPYSYAFGADRLNPLQPNLAETHLFLRLCSELGIKLVNLTAGSPYYNPHIQRPAAYPPSDGYLPPEDPLIGVARQILAVRDLRQSAPAGVFLVGTAYTYLQEFLPHVAQAVLRAGWVDLVGIGRMALAYPEIFADVLNQAPLRSKLICRTFSDCTSAPRNGLPSGCYPLDPHYANSQSAQRLKAAKAATKT